MFAFNPFPTFSILENIHLNDENKEKDMHIIFINLKNTGMGIKKKNISLIQISTPLWCILQLLSL